VPASRLGEFLCSERLLGAIALLVELGYRRLVVRHRASPNPAGLAPEVGLEFTYGIISIMSLRKLLKNLTKI